MNHLMNQDRVIECLRKHLNFYQFNEHLRRFDDLQPLI
jgi:hypothetical protein